jgi:flagellar motor switch protein FliM
MDEQLLSQEEINLLLKTLEKEEKKEVKTDKEVQPFDVSALEHIYAGRLPSLEFVFERWTSGI